MVNKSLPKQVQAFLNGQDFDQKKELAMYFVTVDDEGFPYKAMISVGEVIALDETTLRIALWEHSKSASFTKQAKKATLFLVLPPTAYDLQLTVTYVRTEAGQVIFEGALKQVKVDEAPYATIVSSVQCRFKEEQQTVQQWSMKHKLLKK
ncbi:MULTISPECIES: hypothetical protein [Bacillaceae]|uniref:Pyridoxamine 5'-phosphate oxidase putative domain-containing protein n=2 Tax=Bacillaceae TaxID=186817 RepID=A0A9D5DL30_9BACI|nr:MULTISPECIES: hypothetical protein [Bacillaceae]KQL55688.1 hypothetical protein AN965_17665 [Alkalicoccobacillus plakortidis]MBG9783731.1 hypothetical protein [Shouchella lehensis]TES51312.1 hypothetical protein E2L03_05165 [Shouchella lehensis]